MPPYPDLELDGDQILHLDRHLVVVNKPAGHPVHPTRDPDHPNLEAAVRRHLGLDGQADKRVTVAHRLDAWTSGTLVLALDTEAARALNQLFADRAVDKVYEAVCIGGPDDDSGGLKHYLARRRDTGRKAMHPVPSGGKEAISRYRAIGRGNGLSLVEFKPSTGRTHQLRVQAAAEGWPILGDDIYGPGWDVPLPEHLNPPSIDRRAGQLLHARSIAFNHPLTGEPLAVDAPPPADFDVAALPLRDDT